MKALTPSSLGIVGANSKDRPTLPAESSSVISEAIIVLGMHRSGTSAVSGTLMRLGGGEPKTLMPANDGNQRGYFESVALMELHDELLKSADSSWTDWREFNPEWRRSAVAVDFRRRAKELFLAEFAGSALPVLKDPRICRFAPFWFDVLREMEIRPSIVIPVRSPLDVARSVGKLQGLTLTHGLLLWLRHVLDAEASSRNEARSIFAWQDFREDWRGVCERIGVQTHIAWPRLSDRTSRGIERFLANELVHHNTDRATLAAHGEVNEWTLRAYDALLELARNPHSNSALATLDEIRGLLNQSCQIFGRLLVDLEVELEEARSQAHSAATAGAAQSEREAEIVSRAEQAERTLEETLREKTSLAETINQMNAERESLQAEHSALLSQLSSHQKEIEEKTTALADSAQRLEWAEHELEVSQSERAALAAELQLRGAALNANDLALREIQERAERAERAYAELQDTHSQLRTELQRIRYELNERTSASSKLAARLERAEQVRSQAESARETLADALAHSDALLDELRKAHSTLEAEALSRLQELETKATALSELSTRAEQAELRRDELERQNTRLQRSLVDSAAEHGNMRREMEEAARKADALSAQWDQRAAEGAAREAELARSLTETQTSRDATFENMRAKLVDAEAALAASQVRVAKRGIGSWLLADPRRQLAKRLLNSGLFDVDYYRKQYSGGHGDLAAVEHYLAEGYCNGYRPNAFFDTRWYLDRHEDVRRSGVNPLLHYLLHGVQEGRDPGPQFQTNYYLGANADVRESGANPLAHYLQYGRHEGRLPAPPA